MKAAVRLRGGRQGRWFRMAFLGKVQLPCAGGGKGRPAPCTARPADIHAWHDAEHVLAHNGGMPSYRFMCKHHLQGVWGRATPTGSARGEPAHPDQRKVSGGRPHP